MPSHASGTPASTPPRDRPLLIFDGACGFCRWWVERWKVAFGSRVAAVPFQEAGAALAEIPEGAFVESVHLLEPSGDVYAGAEAVFRALARVPGRGWMLWLYRRLPAFAAASEWIYRRVATHRVAASRLTRWLVGPDPRPSTYLLSRRIFWGVLGLVHGVAFASIWVQLDGLLGSDGLSPAAESLELVRERLGADAYLRAPTLAWLCSSDSCLHALCAAGVLLSVLLAVGIAPAPVLALLWAAYLSLVTVGDVFLRYQWDNLLLETAFLAIFLSPWTLRPGAARRARVSPIALWLLRWLLFRLMFMSGMAKLLSGDETWRNLTALQYHYFTQPLPAWTSWYVHWLPAELHRISSAMTFTVELGAAFLIFGPRRLRQLACGAFLLLQAMIGSTGNYGFFNPLTLALCVLLLDDRALRSLVPARLRRTRLAGGGDVASSLDPPPPARAGRVVRGAVFCLVLGLSGIAMLHRLGLRVPVPAPAEALQRAAAPFRTVNSYGLFAIMTTERREILVEGSRDGEIWRPYAFKWKPGALDRAPRFVQPHMPRLDWQMWFAALGRCERNAWFVRFQARLLRGAPAVSALLARDPFPDEPPRYVRSTVHRYEFAAPGAGGESGDWWTREAIGAYCPVLTLDGDRVTIADP